MGQYGRSPREISVAQAPDGPSYLEIRWEAEKWMLLRLTTYGTQLSFRPGETVIREGEPGDALFLILAGTAEVLRGGDAGGPRAVALLGPFRSFGEVSVLVDRPRTATVAAATPLRCVRLTRRQLMAVEERDPGLALRLYRLMAQSLARSLLAWPR